MAMVNAELRYEDCNITSRAIAESVKGSTVQSIEDALKEIEAENNPHKKAALYLDNNIITINALPPLVTFLEKTKNIYAISLSRNRIFEPSDDEEETILKESLLRILNLPYVEYFYIDDNPLVGVGWLMKTFLPKLKEKALRAKLIWISEDNVCSAEETGVVEQDIINAHKFVYGH